MAKRAVEKKDFLSTIPFVKPGGVFEAASSVFASVVLILGLVVSDESGMNFLRAYGLPANSLLLLAISIAIVAFSLSYTTVLHFDKKLLSAIPIALSGIAALIFQEFLSPSGSIRMMSLAIVLLLLLSSIVELYKRNFKTLLASFWTSISGGLIAISGAFWLSIAQLDVPRNYLLLTLVCVIAASLPKVLDIDLMLSLPLSAIFIALSTLLMLPMLHGISPIRITLMAFMVFAFEAALDLLFEPIDKRRKLNFVSIGFIVPLCLGSATFVITTLFLTF